MSGSINGMRVLVVSPTPTDPPDAGNRARILLLTEALSSWGHDVHFLHIQREGGDVDAMSARWKDRLHLAPYHKPNRRESFRQRWWRRLRQLISHDLRYTSGIDDWYDPESDRVIERLKSVCPFDVVLVEYVFFSRALSHFGPQTLKFIDTHDVFTNRHRIYLQNRIAPKFFSTTAQEEGKGLDRADVVIAIQRLEAETLKGLTRRPVITVGHLVKLASTPPRVRSPRSVLLFVGSVNPINGEGIRWFVRNCLPAIRSAVPAVTLRVAGRVCELIADVPGVECIGPVANLGEVYMSADVVVNPVQYGTGLNIKSIEALGYGLPLVASAPGGRGLEVGADRALLIARDAEEFAQDVVTLLKEDRRAEEMSRAALDLARAFNDESLRELRRVLSEFSGHVPIRGRGVDHPS